MNTRIPKPWSPEFFNAVNPETISVGIHIPEPEWISPPLNVRLSDFNLWYTSEGSGSLQINGQWRSYEAGDLITLKPGDIYQRERTGKNPFHNTFVHLHPFGTKDHALNHVLAAAWPLKISLLHRPGAARLFTQYFETYATRSKNASLAVKGTALQLLDIIFDELGKTPVDRKPRATRNLLRAKELIETRFAEHLTLEEIAGHSELSKSHLSALFKRHLGYSPIEYLLHVRIREAKLLLAQGVLVKEAAYATGFESQHYFSRQFKKKTGQSPTDFAAHHIYPLCIT